jgi:hypothetical protein
VKARFFLSIPFFFFLYVKLLTFPALYQNDRKRERLSYSRAEDQTSVRHTP